MTSSSSQAMLSRALFITDKCNANNASTTAFVIQLYRINGCVRIASRHERSYVGRRLDVVHRCWAQQTSGAVGPHKGPWGVDHALTMKMR